VLVAALAAGLVAVWADASVVGLVAVLVVVSVVV